MKYMGSKNRIAKYILPIILKDRKNGQHYIEPFVGGANLIDKVTGFRIGADYNRSLILCLNALTAGWIPPKEISRELYNEMRSLSAKGVESAIIGYVGINGSYGGRWFDGGFAGISTIKCGKKRNYPAEAFNNVMKQVPNLIGIEFSHSDYKTLALPAESIIYCDPPYANVKKYKTTASSNFNHSEFWDWCRLKCDEGHSVFISEYAAPSDFVCVWEKEVKSSLSTVSKNSVERLFIPASQ